MPRYTSEIPMYVLSEPTECENVIREAIEHAGRHVPIGGRATQVSWFFEQMRRMFVIVVDFDEPQFSPVPVVLNGARTRTEGAFNLQRGPNEDPRAGWRDAFSEPIRTVMREVNGIPGRIVNVRVPTQQDIAAMIPELNRPPVSSVIDHLIQSGEEYMENKKGEKVPIKPKEPPAPVKRRMKFRE